MTGKMVFPECQSANHLAMSFMAHAPQPTLQGTWRLCETPGYKAPT